MSGGDCPEVAGADVEKNQHASAYWSIPTVEHRTMDVRVNGVRRTVATTDARSLSIVIRGPWRTSLPKKNVFFGISAVNHADGEPGVIARYRGTPRGLSARGWIGYS